MQRTSLFPRVRAATQRHLNGYIQLPQIVTDAGISKFITPSVWGNKAVSFVFKFQLPPFSAPVQYPGP
jgi:hypothetical protein